MSEQRATSVISLVGILIIGGVKAASAREGVRSGESWWGYLVKKLSRKK